MTNFERFGTLLKLLQQRIVPGVGLLDSQLQLPHQTFSSAAAEETPSALAGNTARLALLLQLRGARFHPFFPIARVKLYSIESPTGLGPSTAAVANSGYSATYMSRTSSTVRLGSGSGSLMPLYTNIRGSACTFIITLLQLL